MTDKIRKIMGVGLFALAFSLVWGGRVQAQTCLTQPSCDTLGYKQSESDCSGLEQVLKCPFDQTKMFCVDTQPLQVGAILYSDKTTSSRLISGKTPIGVVFDVNKRLAIALDETNAEWGETGEDVHALENCSSTREPLSCGTDGKANTAVIIAFGKNKNISYPAAEYCNKYKTAGTKAGDWFLPSYVELKKIYDVKSMINPILNILGKSSIGDDVYWSSTEEDMYFSSNFDMDIGGSNAEDRKDYSYNVLPIIAF